MSELLESLLLFSWNLGLKNATVSKKLDSRVGKIQLLAFFFKWIYFRNDEIIMIHSRIACSSILLL